MARYTYNKWDDRDLATLRELWQAGKMDKEIALVLKRPVRSISTKRAILGLLNPKAVAGIKPVPDDLAHLYAAFGLNKLAAHYKVSYRTVMQWLKIKNIPVRSVQESNKLQGRAARKASEAKNFHRPVVAMGNAPAIEVAIPAQAAQHLRRHYSNVYHLGRENLGYVGIWQVGRMQLPEIEMIDLARSKGFKEEVLTWQL